MTSDPVPAPTRLPVLSSSEADAVEALVAGAARADGGHPVSEAALLALRGSVPGQHHLLAHDGAGTLVGYAQLPADGGAELLVAPAARRRGTGAALAAALEDAAAERGGEALRVWAHGGSAAAAALAARRGYLPVRELQHRSRPLSAGGGVALPPVEVPDDVQLRAFEVGRDERAWLALNAAAFAGHPEQGRWTDADLATRTAEPWFDPEGLLLAVDAQDGRLLASHWTKVEEVAGRTEGEVYVVAVDPGSQGRGLGGAVVLAGLHHLDLRGAERAGLYVEGDNAPALRLYQRLGFGVDGVDVLYARPAGGAAQG